MAALGLTASQQSALAELDEFIADPAARVFFLYGANGAGKRTVVDVWQGRQPGVAFCAAELPTNAAAWSRLAAGVRREGTTVLRGLRLSVDRDVHRADTILREFPTVKMVLTGRALPLALVGRPDTTIVRLTRA